jgi:hypothetical protein
MPAPSGHSTRTAASIAFLVLLSLLSSVWMIFTSPKPWHIKGDRIAARSDERFAAVKSHLPANGIIGYIGETGDLALPDYYLTQYALAPLVIDRSAHRRIVIGNFPDTPHSEIPPDLKLVQDFGNGVLLFAGKETK